MPQLEIYTDGASCGRKVGPGGWGLVFVQDDTIIGAKSGGKNIATNNQMELMAPIRALKIMLAKGYDSAVLYTDSQYVQKGITLWQHSWKRQGWKTITGEPVKNKELWQQLIELNSKLDIEWKWVKGHSGNEYNDIADKLAVTAKKNRMKPCSETELKK